MIYSLFVGEEDLSLEIKKVQQLKIRSIKSLRSMLGVLTRTNLNKILKECEKKIDNKKEGGMTDKDFKAMGKRVEKLYNEKKKTTNIPIKD
jgi:hypothetical protein